MPELVLPGVYITERPEALIVSGPVTVGNIGIVGTARQGPIGEVQVLGSIADARDTFGAYDAFVSPATPNQPLTLVRALELAYNHGASTVFAIRVTSTEAAASGDNFIEPWKKNTKARRATLDVAAAAGVAATLKAKRHGSWGNDITVTITDAPPTQVKVAIKYLAIEEDYSVATGTDLVKQITDGSAIVDAVDGAQAAAKPGLLAETKLTGGGDGADASDADYALGLEQLLNENVHLMVAAGLDDTVIGDELKAHVELASSDKIKRDRIAIVGSRAKKSNEDVSAFLAAVTKPSVPGARVVFVTPGIQTTDAASGKAVTLPGAYAAAAIAGMLSGGDPQVSLTNKTLSVADVEVRFNSAQLKQLVTAGVLALENRRGIRVVRAVTTDLGAFQQITTRRIVDYAKFGVRASADPFIGLLNNDRVRKALKGAINGFLAGMVDDEMITGRDGKPPYELDVTATGDQERRGIAQVTMTLRPTFSIDYIQVTMFLG